jgi:predicted dehydrogenase
MSKIKCAVIGVGYLGRFHAQKYTHHPEVELIGVYDRNQDHAQAVAAELQVPAFDDLGSLMNDVDAVSIAASTKAHYEIAKFCLQKGKHVLIEKPVTETVAQAQELIEAAQAKNLIIQVGHLERFNPAYQQFLSYAKNIRLIEAQRLATFKKRGSDVDVILDLMIHDLDLILAMVASEIIHIHAQGIALMTKDIDIANVSLSFANGCVAHLSASRVYTGLERLMRVYQDDAYYALNFQQQKLTRYNINPECSDGIFLEAIEIECHQQDALNAQIHEFVHAVKNKTRVQVDGPAALKALDLAQKIQHIIAKEKSLG